MNKHYFIIFFISSVCFAQSKDTDSSKYLEDQLYIGITYNTLENLPKTISQNGFSNGIFLGFIKDLPVNERRSFGFGLGIGYGRNTYFQNLKIFEENGTTLFQKIDNFKRNKFSLHTIELPIEIRWRASAANKYKFWRVYTGLKMGYVFASNAKLKKDGTIKVNGISEIEKFQYGLTLAVGHGTWNLNIYYGLSNIFSGAKLTNANISIEPRELRIGLIFYIL